LASIRPTTTFDISDELREKPIAFAGVKPTLEEPMIRPEKALEVVLNSAGELGAERVNLSEAAGRILAEDVAADADIPAFDRAVFDGYACRREDLAGELTVVETIPAGVSPGKTIGPGQCAKIMTGAAVPRGADCVIMIEQTEEVGDNAVKFTGRRTGDNIRPRGRDIKAGEILLHKGGRVKPEYMAVLASVGHVQPLVANRPRVGIIATGDELVQPSVKPGASQIRNSNSLQLVAQLGSTGAVVRDYGIVKDIPAEIDRALKTALDENDVLLISGGVSVGDFDFVPEMLKQNGVNVLFHKVAVKPGKPMLFGISEGVYCFGLPGNPVSTFTAFELFVKPFLYKLMGHSYSPLSVRMSLSGSVMRKDTERQRWIPVKIIDEGTVQPVDYHGSAHILALCQADGLIRMEIGAESIEKGAKVCVRLV